MSGFSILGGRDSPQLQSGQATYEQRMASFALSRVLEFTGYTIDQVINDSYVRHEVMGYYRLYRFIVSRCDELAECLDKNNDGKVQL